MNKATTEKQTTRIGKRIGNGKKATVSIAINDENREVSRFLEVVKKHYSQKRVTAAEVYRNIVMRGLTSIFEEIALNQTKPVGGELERLQGHLFDDQSL